MAATNSVIVAIVPHPGFSHVNSLFLLARLIASHNIPVHFICLSEFNQDLKLSVKGEYFGDTNNIHFNDILIPPVEYCESTGNGDDRMVLFRELMKQHWDPVQRTCLELSKSTKKLVIIYDSIMRVILGDVHSCHNVDTYIFHVGSALSKYSMLRQSINDLDVVDDDHEKLLHQMHDEFPTMDSCYPPLMDVFVKDLHEWDLNSGEFMISSREVEGKYFDLLANAKNKKPLWALGPLHMLLQLSHHDSTSYRHECLEFLDNQDVNSVIFISFGSTPKLSQEQVNELAFGLEKSNQRFIWVIGKGDHDNNTNNKKGADKFEKKFGKIELPQGFEERVKSRGMAVRNWVPQLDILGHPSTGGFLSHCGWNSCMESISMGVPIIAWPNEWEQPYNAILVTNVLKIGISLFNWTRKDELVTSESIEKSVKILMDTTEGEEMRKRAVELSNKIKSSVSPGGATSKEVESFISYITK
ncbi:zeatin O-glucosyltransferase-like [Solanum stenotomum]|uniref:zeatin O-glucosyltransferase-like n=1 Tax=Solanum stenotomum TaxID=172797 RepID=UPI0020D07766|nr:zeatin O-glucosyltransferase-like [Solanum stenotomum]